MSFSVRKSRRAIPAFFAVLPWVAVSTLHAHDGVCPTEGAPTGVIVGAVAEAETGQAVAGAFVRLTGTDHGAATNRSGRFRISGVPVVCFHDLEVESLGFGKTVIREVLVRDGETVDLGVLHLDVTPVLMEQIQVTAGRDARSIADTPARVSMVRRDQMERQGVTKPTHALKAVPGLVVSSAYHNWESVMLRGMPRTGNEFTTTLLLIDGVPQTDSRNSSRIINLPLDGVNQIEVVQGPNAAQYGRTAVGGVVNILTAQPTPELRSSLELEAGQYGHYKAKGTVSGPVADWGGVYLSGSHGRFEGFWNQDFTPRFRDDAIYGKINFAPGDRSEGFVSLNYVVTDNAIPTPEPVIERRPLSQTDDRFHRFDNLNLPGSNYHQKEFRSTLNYRWELSDHVSLVEVLGYRQIQYKFENAGEVMGAPFDFERNLFTQYPFEMQTDENILYQDLRLEVGRVLANVEDYFQLGFNYEYTTGYNEGNLIYTDEDTFGWPINYLNPQHPAEADWQRWRFGGNDYRLGILALYGKYRFEPTARFVVDAGARFDQASQRNILRFRDGEPVIRDRFTAFSPKVGVTFRLLRHLPAASLGTVNLNLYSTYAKAFMPPRTVSGLRPADEEIRLVPEDVYNYELGFKGDALDGRVFFEGALFTMKRDNVILSTREGPFFRPSNEGVQNFRGVEAGLRWRVGDQLSLDGNAAFYRHRFGDEFVIQTAAGDLDLTDNWLPFSPNQVVNVGVNWDHPVGLGLAIHLDHMGDHYMDQRNTYKLDAYNLVNVGLTWRFAGGHSTTLGLRNLFDHEHYVMGDISNAETAHPGSPRQLTLISRFKLR
jgi:iron complex outermembrane recepter protein